MTNPLTDALPIKVRRYIYALAFVAGLGVAAWQASGGDWGTAASVFVASLIPALAGSNAPDADIDQ